MVTWFHCFWALGEAPGSIGVAKLHTSWQWEAESQR
jgi:hypothetical protein